MNRLFGFWVIASLLFCWSGARTEALSATAAKSVVTPYVNGAFRALIIGNNEYKDPEGLWNPLKTPINDAEAVVALLQKRYGFNRAHISLLKNATRAQILSEFSKLAKVSKENDSIFIYYAGHGYSDPDTQEAYWIPVDAVGKQDYTYVRNSTIKSKLTVVADHAKHVFLVSDSCFSGTLLREGHRGLKMAEKTDQYYRKVAQKKSVQILAAGGLEYVDDDYKQTGHSPFTYYFIEQLKQSPENYFSATEVSLEVTKAVSKNVYQTPEKGVLHGAGDNNGEFFFVKADSAQKPATAAQAPETRAAAPEQFNAEAEMWALVKDSSNIDDIKTFLAAFPQGKLTPVATLKLQQLERVQQRGKQPGIEGKPMAAVVPETKSSHPGVTLALFPGKFRSKGKRAYGKSLNVISKMLKEANRIETIYSYYPLSMDLNVKSIDQELDPVALWDKGSMFSGPKPQTDVVCRHAEKLGADLVIMYYLNVEKQGSNMTVYAIDVKKKKTYTAKASQVEWRLDGPRTTGSLTKEVFKGYFEH